MLLKEDHLVYLRKKLAELEAAEKLSPSVFQKNITAVIIAIERWPNFFKSTQDQKEEQQTRISDGLEVARRVEIENAFLRSNQRARRVVGQRLSDVSNFKDRLYERQLIGALLARPSTRIVSIVSRGGMGKTAIASKILADLEMNRWPQIELDEAQVPVDGIIYLSTRTSGISLERIFLTFAELVSGEKGEAIQAIWINLRLDTSSKIIQLLEILENNFYILLLDNAASYYNQLRLPQEQWTSLPDVEPHLREFEHLLLASEYEQAATILETLDLQLPPVSSYLFQWGHVKRAKEMRERLTAKLSKPTSQWTNWHQLGLACTRLGLINEAIQAHEAAVALTREIKEPHKEGTSLVYLGLVFSHKEDFAEATKYYLQALPINQGRPMEGNNLGHLGNAYAALDQIDLAVDYLKRASILCNEQADRRSEAFWLGRLGDTYHRAGMVEEAITFLQQALTLAEKINDKQVKIYHLTSLGDIYTDLKRIPEAINAYREAILFANDIGDRLNEVQASWSLGLLYIDTDISQAIVLMSTRVAYEKDLNWPDAEEHAQQVQAIQNKAILQNETH